MSDTEKNAYILGTEWAERHRLGIQHQVWAGEARRGWETAGFGPGQTLLDLGCGPGFCTRDLAYIAGTSGRVIGVDRSASFIDFLQRTSELHGLSIDARCCDFDDMQLDQASLDGIYCRWALAWVPNPDEIVRRCAQALKPGGRFVIHEYWHWGLFRTEPKFPNLAKGIAAALKSFTTSEGEINIGRLLPRICRKAGLVVESTRPMTKLCRVGDLSWQWPQTFLEIYVPKLVEPGLITADEVDQALEELKQLEQNPDAEILCPQLTEIIARRP